jgi:glucose-1-phosphate thymidylyltransferase
MSDTESVPEVVGLIPAGGQGTRIAPLPCSKELYPVGFESWREDGTLRPKVVSHYLLERMKLAGASKIYMVLRPGKWDIPTYFGDGSILGVHIAYLILGVPYGVPFTLDQAFPFVSEATVTFGFPDILFHGDDGFVKLITRQRRNGADVILGLFPATHPNSKEDRVDFSNTGEVRELVLGPPESHLRYSWGIAVWNSRFTRFLHEYVEARKSGHPEDVELSAGHAIHAALQAGLCVDSLVLSEDEPYVDIGTPHNLYRAVTSNICVKPRP